MGRTCPKSATGNGTRRRDEALSAANLSSPSTRLRIAPKISQARLRLGMRVCMVGLKCLHSTRDRRKVARRQLLMPRIETAPDKLEEIHARLGLSQQALLIEQSAFKCGKEPLARCVIEGTSDQSCRRPHTSLFGTVAKAIKGIGGKIPAEVNSAQPRSSPVVGTRGGHRFLNVYQETFRAPELSVCAIVHLKREKLRLHERD